MPQPLIVTAAIIQDNGRVLITQRPPGTRDAGMWEFPGGKLEQDESPEQALQREILEELGVPAKIGSIYEVIHYRYPWGAILLLAYRCELQETSIRHLEVADHRWVLPADLDDFPLLPADVPLVQRLQSERK